MKVKNQNQFYKMTVTLFKSECYIMIKFMKENLKKNLFLDFAPPQRL